MALGLKGGEQQRKLHQPTNSNTKKPPFRPIGPRHGPGLDSTLVCLCTAAQAPRAADPAFGRLRGPQRVFEGA